jgi:uncharacterized protein (DUF58 family)
MAGAALKSGSDAVGAGEAVPAAVFPRNGDARLQKLRTTLAGRPLRLSLLSCVLFWLVESAIHTWILKERSYLANMLAADSHELWMRALVVTLILGIGAISAAWIRQFIGLERENGQLHRELQGALLRHLSGMVAICMHCKSVRNPDDHWDSIEKYLAQRTDLRFSHGICARCFEEFYSESVQAS